MPLAVGDVSARLEQVEVDRQALDVQAGRSTNALRGVPRGLLWGAPGFAEGHLIAKLIGLLYEARDSEGEARLLLPERFSHVLLNQP